MNDKLWVLLIVHNGDKSVSLHHTKDDVFSELDSYIKYEIPQHANSISRPNTRTSDDEEYTCEEAGFEWFTSECAMPE